MVPALLVEDAAKRYGRVQALDGVSLEVQPGELVGLLGPNGAGKSTLVKIACGLIRASRGRAEICGAPAGSPRARAALGYLAELFRFPGWYSADEVLRLHQRLAGSPGGDDERGQLLELVGLANARAVRVDAMSKGMQQRLGIAQALVGSPPVLLLDEPTSALDPAGRRTVRALLEELRAREIGVLLNSHLLSEVELVCDRVVILSHGRVVAAGRPEDLSQRARRGDRDRRGNPALPRGAARSGSWACRAARPRGPADLRGTRARNEPRGGVPRGGGRRHGVRALPIIAGYALQEALRRRIFHVVLLLTAVYLGLYWLGADTAFEDVARVRGRPPGR